jgi:hypothetical protein
LQRRLPREIPGDSRKDFVVASEAYEFWTRNAWSFGSFRQDLGGSVIKRADQN